MNRVMQHLPKYYEDIKEFRELTDSIVTQLDLIDDSILQVENDQFILTSSELAILRREKEYKINPDKTIETLDFRKKRLLARMMQKAPFTFRYLIDQLDELVGEGKYSIRIDVINFYIEVLVNVESQSYYRESAKMLERTIPLNMTLDTGVLAEPTHIIIRVRAYDFNFYFPITNTFHTAEIPGVRASGPLSLEERAYSFDIKYPVTNMFSTSGITGLIRDDMTFRAMATSNKIVYPRTGVATTSDGSYTATLATNLETGISQEVSSAEIKYKRTGSAVTKGGI